MINTVAFSRGLFGKAPDPRLLEDLLKQLSLWDKRDARHHDFVRRRMGVMTAKG